ncbi:DUF6675 family protein [Treponema sp. HNW]|uniref:DUF6675 family protein n=1 Tax=Treponema sp. HNW TaxID=3116654 RepID=UPI003D0EB7A0
MRYAGLPACLPEGFYAALRSVRSAVFCGAFVCLCLMLGARTADAQSSEEDYRVDFSSLIQDEGNSTVVPVYELKELFSESVAEELLKTGRIQRSFYGESNVKLELCPATDLCRSAASAWDKQNEPVFIVESLYLLKKTSDIPKSASQDEMQNGTERVPRIIISRAAGEIGKISSVLRNLSTMQGIQYYSNSRKRWETLYTEVYTVNNPDERTRIPDPADKKADGLVSYVYQKDRSLSGCVYKFQYFEQAAQTSFRAENTEKIVYKGFNIVKPEAMLLCLNAVETEEHIVFYITVRADAAKIPLVSERLAKSYGSRADAIYNWCVSKYSEE